MQAAATHSTILWETYIIAGGEGKINRGKKNSSIIHPMAFIGNGLIVFVTMYLQILL